MQDHQAQTKHYKESVIHLPEHDVCWRIQNLLPIDIEVATDQILCLDGVWITVVKSWEVNNPMAFVNPSSFLHPEKLTVLRLKSNFATKRWQTPLVFTGATGALG